MMWPSGRKKTLTESGIFRGFTDWHCHILPGVDDGVRTMDEALGILDLYGRLGVKTVWLTPHVMEDAPNATARLRERFGELEAAYKGGIGLRLSAEYMLDNLFRKRLADGDLLPLGEQGDMLLVETSCYSPPANFYGLLDEIKSKGYRPVLAHPERYAYMEKGDYGKLKGMGVRLQVNLPSLAGLYGREARRRGGRLMKDKAADLLGTDTHSMGMIQDCLEGKLSTDYKNTGTVIFI